MTEHVDRRTALKVLAAAPLLLRTVPADAVTATPKIDYLAHTLVWRQGPDAPSLFDDGADLRIGTVYNGFLEVWESAGGQYVRRVSQEPNGCKYRIVGKDDRHSWTFSDYNNIDRFACDDPNALYLQDVG